MPLNLREAFYQGTMWAQVAKGGPFHAVRRCWWDEERWARACSPRRGAMTDLQFFSLDAEPTGFICGQTACREAFVVFTAIVAKEPQCAS